MYGGKKDRRKVNCSAELKLNDPRQTYKPNSPLMNRQYESRRLMRENDNVDKKIKKKTIVENLVQNTYAAFLQ